MSPELEVIDSKQKLIDAAIKLFASQGYDGTSVKDLAEAAGINVSMVSYYFGGKEGLYRKVLSQFGEERLGVSQKILISPKSAEEMRVRLEMYVDEFIQCHLDYPDLATIVQRECEMESPHAEDIFEKTFLKGFTTLVEFLTDCQKKKFIKTKTDLVLATSMIFGTICNAARKDRVAAKYFKKSLKEKKYKVEFRDQLLSIFFEGVENEK